MNTPTKYAIRPESLQLVVGGLVPEMQYAGATFDFPTSEAYAVIQAHRPRDASEPRPLVGEGELKQERLRRVIVELEAERDQWGLLAGTRRTNGWPKGARAARSREIALNDDIATKRRELDALTYDLARRTLPSPTNDPSSATREEKP